MQANIEEITEVHWNFAGEPPAIRPRNDYSNAYVRMDPTPAYAHNIDLVRETLRRCEEAFPTKNRLDLFNVHFESLGRINGETRDWSNYKEMDEYDRYITGSMILLFGKRTPIHPAMTRYLVAHEYGHAVDRALSHKMFTTREPWDSLRDEYVKLRKLPERKHYGPGTWHEQPAELLANDFRYLVMGIEKEFWPHSVPPPDQIPEVVEWWENAKKLDLTPVPKKKSEG